MELALHRLWLGVKAASVWRSSAATRPLVLGQPDGVDLLQDAMLKGNQIDATVDLLVLENSIGLKSTCLGGVEFMATAVEVSLAATRLFVCFDEPAPVRRRPI